MKLNFIQSLPEDQAKENYELKAKLQEARQQLADFEASLGEAVTAIAPNKPLRATPALSLKQLVKSAKQQHSQLMSALHRAEVLRGEREQLQRLQISQTKAISEREIEITTLKQYREEEGRRNAQRQRQLEEEIEQLQEKNDKIVEQLQSFKIQRIGKEGSPPDQTGSFGTLESSLRAQLVRAVLQRQQFQNKLQLKAREVQKSQRDKEALEKYYDQKWNSEYKKVKIKLEQTYNLKIAQLEEQSQLRLLAIENQLRQMQQEKVFYLERNEELQGRFNEDQKAKETLTTHINELACKIDDFKLRNVENSLMFREEIRTIKVIHSEKIVHHVGELKRLESKIEGLKSELIECRSRHTTQMTTLKALHQEQLCKQTETFETEKQRLLRKQREEIQQLQSDIFQQLDNAQIIKNQAERQFQSAIEQLKADHEKGLILKDREFQSNNRRWIDKHCELENLLVINRRKFQEEMKRKAAEVDRLVQKEYALHREIEGLKDGISKLEGQTQNLQGTLLQKNQLIAEKEAFIASLSRDLANSIKQNEILLNNRKQWKNELLEVGREFKQTFDDLKRTHDIQINLCKGKIAELEDVNGKRLAMKRDGVERTPFNHERQLYKPEIHIREAENLILHKVKDYYETKLREDGELAKTNYKNSHAILARKLKKNRTYVQEASSHRIFEPRESIANKTRYSNSVQKHYNLSLSKEKFREEKPRVQTMTSFK